MSVGTRHLTLLTGLGSALLALGACENSSAPDYQSDLRVADTTSAKLVVVPLPTPAPIPTPHPWVGKTIRIYNIGETRCLEPQVIMAGAAINMNFCHPADGSDLAQRFVVVRAGSVLNGDITSVSFKLAMDTTLCLEVKNGTALGGEQIQLAACKSSTRQTFYLPTRAPGATFTSGAILTKVSAKAMALDIGNAGVGVLVKQQPYPNITQVLHYREWTGHAYFVL